MRGGGGEAGAGTGAGVVLREEARVVRGRSWLLAEGAGGSSSLMVSGMVTVGLGSLRRWERGRTRREGSEGTVGAVVGVIESVGAVEAVELVEAVGSVGAGGGAGMAGSGAGRSKRCAGSPVMSSMALTSAAVVGGSQEGRGGRGAVSLRRTRRRGGEGEAMAGGMEAPRVDRFFGAGAATSSSLSSVCLRFKVERGEPGTRAGAGTRESLDAVDAARDVGLLLFAGGGDMPSAGTMAFLLPFEGFLVVVVVAAARAETEAGVEAGRGRAVGTTDVARDAGLLFFAGGGANSSARAAALRLPFPCPAVGAGTAVLMMVVVVVSSQPNIFLGFRTRCPRPPISIGLPSTMSMARLWKTLPSDPVAPSGNLGPGALPWARSLAAALLDTGFGMRGMFLVSNFSQNFSLS